MKVEVGFKPFPLMLLRRDGGELRDTAEDGRGRPDRAAEEREFGFRCKGLD
jgi:hypothetical protein